MFLLIQGGSGSGKSAYAERKAVERYKRACKNKSGKLYYVATMQVSDAEGEEKVARHHALRAGKGFLTLEQPLTIGQAVSQIETPAVVLLECVSNLAANEMFNQGTPKAARPVIRTVTEGITRLAHTAEHLIVVTNNVFEDGCSYDETTMQYIQALGQVNQILAAMADEVIEVIAGIPVSIKPAGTERTNP